MRDFPLFDGDFFPDRLPLVLEKVQQGPPAAPAPAAGGKRKVKLARSETLRIADQMKLEVSGAKWSFLVARLHAAEDPEPMPREKHIGSHELLDSRMHLIELSQSRHWQFDELRRAHWSTMMLLALLGGTPEPE